MNAKVICISLLRVVFFRTRGILPYVTIVFKACHRTDFNISKFNLVDFGEAIIM